MKHKSVKHVYQYNLFIALNADTIADLEPNEYLVEIIFIDGKFAECRYNFHSPYDRMKWRILSLIENEITTLEKYYEGSEKKYAK